MGAAETEARIVLRCPSYAASQLQQENREICWGQKHLTLLQQILYNLHTGAVPSPHRSLCSHIPGEASITHTQDTALKAAYTGTCILEDNRGNRPSAGYRITHTYLHDLFTFQSRITYIRYLLVCRVNIGFRIILFASICKDSTV